MIRTEQQQKATEQETERPEDFRDERFGWVWMDSEGVICVVCRMRQPQTRSECVKGHPPSEPGIPIPWRLA